MLLTQMPLSKNSLNEGDSFILYANPSLVWLWNGHLANPDEKFRANRMAERMCTQGTVTTMEQGYGDEEYDAFWAYLGDGDIQPADDGDKKVEEFSPVLYRLSDDPNVAPILVATGNPVKIGFGRSSKLLAKHLLDEDDVFLLDAGWEIFVWIGKQSDRSEKLAAVRKSDEYAKKDPLKADLPLTIIKSGHENADFLGYFHD